MIIGIDLDNTIICYDETVYDTALSLGFIDNSHQRSKREVRNSVRKLKKGEGKWQEIQRSVYGEKMHDARIFAGVKKFLEKIRKDGHQVYVVSHKTKYHDCAGKKINLIKNTLKFLEKKNFFDLVQEKNIFFEETREEKIERIGILKCDYFVDDLEEVFLEPAFPQDTVKILFDPGDKSVFSGIKFTSWKEIHDYLFR